MASSSVTGAGDGGSSVLDPVCRAVAWGDEATLQVVFFDQEIATASMSLEAVPPQAEKEDWKIVPCMVADGDYMRPAHLARDTTGGGKLLALAHVRIVGAGAGWDDREFMVPTVCIRELGEPWEDFWAYIVQLFVAPAGDELEGMLVAPRGLWCAWPIENCKFKGGLVALSRADLLPRVPPLKNQRGALESTAGTKRSLEVAGLGLAGEFAEVR